MIKSAHLTASVSRKAGGLFEAVSRLVQAQHQQGVAVKVFGLWDEFFDADQKGWCPVPVSAFQPAWPGMLAYSPEFLAELNAFAPDITHTHGLWLYPSVATRNFSRKNQRPYLISPHGMLDPWALNNSRWKKKLAYALFERGHLHGARCLRALCSSEADSMRQLRLKNSIAVIPNGIDLPPVTAPSAPPWGNVVEPGKKVLLFLSRIHPKKGLVNLLRAWSQVQSASRGEPAWVLAIAGWDQGGHEAELKRLCAELLISFADIRDHPPASNLRTSATVVFLGPQFNEAKAACYQHCEAFVLPSYSEGLPMVVLEAWAYSKPVIMTPECNLPEGFQAGAALKVATTGAGVVAGLNELLGMTDAERMTMGRRAHGLVVERFTWSRVAQQLQAVQEWILGGGAKPDCLLET